MVFGFIFAFVATLAAWVASFLPTTGCGTIGSFPTLNAGWIGAYFDLTALSAMFGLIVAFELAVMGYRLAVGIYKLLPLS